MVDVPVDACRGKALTVLVLVFLGGGASGVIGSRVFNSVVSPTPVVETRDDLSETKLGALEHLREELVLDAAQVQQVREILDQCIMHEADLMMQIRMNQSSSRESILRTLNEQQRYKFESELLGISSKPDASF